jgi:DNA-binding NtrC family response regulator
MNNKILIVDDDEELCEELSDTLSGEGYSVNCVHNGEEGKNLIIKDIYDVVLLDIKLPRLNGYEILKLTKDRHSKSKIFILSGRPNIKILPTESMTLQQKIEEDALKLADKIFSKPFDVQNILEAIKNALN